MTRAVSRRATGGLGFALAALAALAAGACRNGAQSEALGTLERERIELTAEANEPIGEIAVREGDAVQAGQTLLRLDPVRLDARVAAARAARDQAQAALAEMQRGPRAELIAQARSRLAAAQSALATARRERARIRELAARDFASQSRGEEVQNQVAEAQARRDQAQSELDAMLRGATREELDQAQGALAAASAALAEIEVQRARLEIRAPADGVVDSLPFELGERPPAGAVAVVMLARSAPYARVYVPEPVRTSLRPGDRAEIRVDGYAEPFEGRLRSIASDPSFTPYFSLTRSDRSRLSYVAEIDLLGGPAARLPSGVPVEVRFPAPAARADESGLAPIAESGDGH